MSRHVVKINLPGGFISAGDLYEILVVAETAGAKHIRFGNRQQLYFEVDKDELEDVETDMLRAAIDYELDADVHANIVSSYVCDSIFAQESWLREGVYKDIFDLFTYQPKLKINLIDRHQTFIPFFTGNINFISADVSNYWYMYVRFPKTSRFYCWPALIYSDDIPLISKKAEDVILKNKGLFYDQPNIDEHLFYQLVERGLGISTQQLPGKLVLPDFNLPYYEGFNRYANNKYWLGIYRRNELFAIDFLKDVCQLCLQSRVGQLYTTPWKSIIIKGIEQADRKFWGMILDKYRLNVRHASNELNWQLEDLSEEALTLKQQLVREFEDADLRTYRLSFTIKTRSKSGLMGSIVIKAQPSGMFELLHTRDFNPNSKDYVSYRTRVKRENLGPLIIELCHDFYRYADEKDSVPQGVIEVANEPIDAEMVHRCKYCLTVYDEAFGDDTIGIPAGIAFDDIDAGYVCPVCDAVKDDFELIAKTW